MIVEPQGEPSDAPHQITLGDLSETSTSLKDLVGEARSEAAWCCDNGCGSGACETCPCCSAGYCVSGFDGIPDDPEDRAWWLEVAAEYNPLAAALRAASTATQQAECRDCGRTDGGCDRVVEPQGEPSDAQVKAFMSGFWAYAPPPGSESRVRAALRAASAVTAHEVKEN